MSDEAPVIYGGRYELHRRLARGGMADVYLARDQLLNRPVAVKVLFAQYASDPAFVERFRREAQAAANLTHPNVVAVFDWGEEADTYYIVMEYVNGRSLADVLRQEGTLLPERAADIGIDIAAALGFAHRNGVVHRDVKPGNVMLAADGQVKVTDFGIARAIAGGADENLTQAGLVMGTATYFSPEQAQGRNVDPRSDVYSLGVVLYEAVCGRPPFRGDDALAVAYQHVQEMPTPPREINASVEATLEAIILKCLAKEPSARYPSSEDLRSDLRRYREGAQISAGPAPEPPEPTIAATTAIPATSATRAHVAYDGGGGGYDDYDPAYDDDYEEEPPKRSAVSIAILVVLLLLLVGVLYLLANALGIIGGDDDEGEPITVPDVVNQPYEEARDQLVDLGFRVDIEFEDNPEVEDGLVFAQDPEGGTEAREDDVIKLTVSEGEELKELPDVVDMTEEQARDVLSADGFTNIEPRSISDPDTEPGRVISQSPEAGTETPLSATIVLEISSGPEKRTIPDDLANRPADEAEAILRNQDLNVSRQEEVSDAVPAGLVIRTNPPGGTEVDENSTVTLFVSAGPEQVTVPPVTEKTEATAKSELELAGFQVNVVEEDLPFGDPDDGRVLSQDPEGGERRDKGSRVTITVGRAATEDTTTSTTEP